MITKEQHYSATYTGNSFNGDSDEKYQTDTLDCDDNVGCQVSCTRRNACQGSNILCPSNNSDCIVTCSSTSNSHFSQCTVANIICPASIGDCTVICNRFASWQTTCKGLAINWNPSNTNTLQCDDTCNGVPYPPPINDNTPFVVNCDSTNECYGTIIICPRYAVCTISCSGSGSCQNAVINCPETANCDITCSASDSCTDTTINWSSTPNLGSLTCANPSSYCPNVIDPPSSSVDIDLSGNLICDQQKNALEIYIFVHQTLIATLYVLQQVHVMVQ